MNKKNISIMIIILSFIFMGISLIFLDDTLPTHLGFDGTPDQFGSKYLYLLFPCILTIIGVSMMLVAKYANVSENYRKYLLMTCVLIETMFFLLEIVFVSYAFLYVEGKVFDFTKILMVIMGLMLIFIGNYMPKVEKNNTLGLKTKWSLYNEVTWQKSNRFISLVAVLCGIIVLVLGLIFSDYVNFIILISIILIMVTSGTIASYIYYKQEINK